MEVDSPISAVHAIVAIVFGAPIAFALGPVAVEKISTEASTMPPLTGTLFGSLALILVLALLFVALSPVLEELS